MPRDQRTLIFEPQPYSTGEGGGDPNLLILATRRGGGGVQNMEGSPDPGLACTSPFFSVREGARVEIVRISELAWQGVEMPGHSF